MKKSIVTLAVLIVLALAVIPIAASTQATNTVSPTDYSINFSNVGAPEINAPSCAPKVDVTVQDAIQLTLATKAGCTVSAGGSFPPTRR